MKIDDGTKHCLLQKPTKNEGSGKSPQNMRILTNNQVLVGSAVTQRSLLGNRSKARSRDVPNRPQELGGISLVEFRPQVGLQLSSKDLGLAIRGLGQA